MASGVTVEGSPYGTLWAVVCSTRFSNSNLDRSSLAMSNWHPCFRSPDEVWPQSGRSCARSGYAALQHQKLEGSCRRRNKFHLAVNLLPELENEPQLVIANFVDDAPCGISLSIGRLHVTPGSECLCCPWPRFAVANWRAGTRKGWTWVGIVRRRLHAGFAWVCQLDIREVGTESRSAATWR